MFLSISAHPTTCLHRISGGRITALRRFRRMRAAEPMPPPLSLVCSDAPAVIIDSLVGGNRTRYCHAPQIIPGR